MKTLLKTVSVLIIIATLAFGGFKLYEGPLFRIKQFHIKLETSSKDKLVFSKIKKNLKKKIIKLKGTSLLILDLSSIKKTILSDKRVESYKLLRRFPNQLYVEISPKKPEALYLSKNKIRLVSSQGEVYLSDLEVNYDLPIMNGKLLGNNKLRRAKVLWFLKNISKNELFNKKNISEIKFKETEGLRVSLNSGLEVILGKEDILNKSMRVEKVLQYIKSNDITCRAIDARYSKKVVVRLRNGS